MTKTEIVKAMLKLQQKLNDQTNGKGWEEGYTKEGKLINFKRCIYMECAELIDSFAWKHWKNINAPTNWNNVHIEIVDIWHFILSLLLEEYKNKDKDFIANEIICAPLFNDFCNDKSSDDDIYGIINDIELIIHKCSGFGFNMGELLSAFFTLAMKCGLDLNKLYKIYISKNILNQFRQDKGYKEGKYIKIWDGVEDNAVLNQILEYELDYNKIYALLEEKYQKLCP